MLIKCRVCGETAELYQCHDWFSIEVGKLGSLASDREYICNKHKNAVITLKLRD